MKTKYRYIWVLKLHLFFIKFYDRFRLRNQKIISQNYNICIDLQRAWNKQSPRYFIMKLIWTQEMVDDVRNYHSQDWEQIIIDEVMEKTKQNSENLNQPIGLKIEKDYYM